MTVTSVEKDLDNLSISIVAEFDAPVERVWQLWADPRQLERWWGPPGYPATMEQHDLAVGGSVTYYMTSPEGAKYRGWWKITAVTPPTSLAFTDGFSNDDGTPNNEMPITHGEVTLSEQPGGTRMEIRSRFESQEQMDQLLTMGMLEGMREAMGQIDAILAG